MGKINTFISFPVSISFQEPTIQHPNGNQSVATVAKALEKKYHLIQGFYLKHKIDISRIMIDEVRRSWKEKISQEKAFAVIGEAIKDMWRRFILDSESGIITMASQDRGNQSFIDTGAYYSSMRIKVE